MSLFDEEYEPAGDDHWPYVWKGDFLWKSRGKDKGGPIVICNARIQIIEDITFDDGLNRERKLLLEIRVRGNVYTGLCEVKEFVKDTRTVIWSIGSADIVIPPRQSEYVREAITLYSSPVKKNVFSHTGWRELPGKCIFLLPSGGFKSKEIEVGVEKKAGWDYQIPSRPSVDKAREGVQQTLRLLEVTDQGVGWPLLSHMFSAPLGPFMPTNEKAVLHLHGITGSWKTTLATLFLNTWGDFSDGLPTESWTSTPAYLAKACFTLKDLPVIIDDYKPSMVKNQDVTRFIQNCADGTARGRLRQDASFGKAYPVKCVVISTGEEALGVEPSVASRVLTAHVKCSMTDPEKLTKAQESCQCLRYGTSAYLEWLVDHQASLEGLCRQKFNTLRDRFTKVVRQQQGHTRVATSAAVSCIGGVIWLHFLKETGYITEDERLARIRELVQAYYNLIGNQLPEVKDQEPDEQFLLILRSLISSNRARVEDRKNPLMGDLARGSAPIVAYQDRHGTYIHNSVAYNLVQEFLAKEGRRLLVSMRSINACLDNKGLISRNSNGKKTKVVRCGDKTIRVIHLPPGFLDEVDEEEGEEGNE